MKLALQALDSDDPTRRRLPDCRRLPGCEDRRAWFRVRRTVPFRYRSGGLLWNTGQTLSLSVTGARAVVRQPLPPGTPVHVRLEMTAEWHPQLVGRVVWQTPMTGGGWVVGLQLEAPFPEDQDRFSRWLRREHAESMGRRTV